MKKFLLLLIISVCLVMAVGCDLQGVLAPSTEGATEPHEHEYGSWKTVSYPTCKTKGVRVKSCNICNYAKYEDIAVTAHTEAVDPRVEPTCRSKGLTEGKHCTFCGEVIIAQSEIEMLDHTPVTDEGAEPTCTEDGITEGSHCSECGEILTAQNVMSALSHDYEEKELISPNCTRSGRIRYTCRRENCGHSYEEDVEYPVYSAGEIFDQARKYVCEIKIYDLIGNPLGTGTGFVISEDGKIVTNYHVIEGGLIAVKLDGVTYDSGINVLAYDEKADLAVIKLNATGLAHANVCTKSMKTGDTVYAIGSSRGYTNTFSQGIVTYSNRSVDGISCVQHDASITFGNSGGPLINVYGEVVGVNTMGVADSQNLNFAVSSSEIADLDYLDAPLSPSEFYVQSRDCFQTLADWLWKNRSESGFKYEDNCISYEESRADGDLAIVYDIDARAIELLVGHEEEGRKTAFGILIVPDATEFLYVGVITADTYKTETYGYIDGATFNKDTESLRCSGHLGVSDNLSDIIALWTMDAKMSLEWLSGVMSEGNVGITLAGLGFTAYVL